MNAEREPSRLGRCTQRPTAETRPIPDPSPGTARPGDSAPARDRAPSSRLFDPLLLFLLASLTGSGSAAIEPPWWDAQWPYRKFLTVPLPPVPPAETFGISPAIPEVQKKALLEDLQLPIFVRVVINGEGHFAPNEADIRVVDPSVGDPAKAVIPHKVVERLGGGEVVLMFRAPPGGQTREFCVYYGNLAAPAPPEPEWSVPAGNAFVKVLSHAYGGYPYSASALKTALQNIVGSKSKGWTPLSEIRLPINPWGVLSGETVVNLYHGFLLIPVDDRYWVSLNSGGTAIVFLDGKETQSAAGSGSPNEEWTRRQKYELREGYHHFLVVQSESQDYHGLWLGIRQSGKSFFTPVGYQMGRAYIEAEVTRFDTQDAACQPFFTYHLPHTAIEIKDPSAAGKSKPGRIAAYVELRDRSRYGKEVKRLWRIDERTAEGSRSAALLDLGTPYDVKLELKKGTQTLGEYSRRIEIPSLPVETVNLFFDVIYFPYIVYAKEQTNITFRLTNETSSPILAECQVVFKGFKTGRLKPFELTVPPKGEESALVPLSFSEFTASTGSIGIKVFVGRQQYFDESFQIIHSPRAIEDLHPGMGCLLNAADERVIITTDLEDPAKYRRGAIFKWVAGIAKSPPAKVLLLGSPMRNEAKHGQQAKTYLDLVKEHFSTVKRQFSFVERAKTLNPILADLPLLARELSKSKPDLVIISPGPDDAYYGESVWVYERSLDVMIDLIRNANPGARIVLVSPPPLAENVKLSALYVEAMRTISRQHHTQFVDLHGLLTKNDPDWLRLYREPGGKVIYLYPTEDGQKRIAEEVLKYVR